MMSPSRAAAALAQGNYGVSYIAVVRIYSCRSSGEVDFGLSNHEVHSVAWICHVLRFLHRRRNHIFTVAWQRRKLVDMHREAARARLALLTYRLAPHEQPPHVVFKSQGNLLPIRTSANVAFFSRSFLVFHSFFLIFTFCTMCSTVSCCTNL